MNQSHDSLKDDYEVTGNELDALVYEGRKLNGVIGTRMTGAGFGGCTVSIVEKESTPQFIKQLGEAYTKKTGLVADFYLPEVGDGAKRL
jgi:galactokinase